MTAQDVPAGQEPEQGDTVTASRPEAQAAVSWNALLATYLPALILALGTGIAVPAIPTLARSFHVSFGLASGVVTAYVLGNLVGTLPAGWLIDRLGARVVLISAPLVTTSMAFSIAVVHSFSVLLVLRFVDGCAAQMWLMARLASISHGAPPGQRGRQISWMFGMNNTGKLVGPVLGGFLAAAFGVRSSFVAYGVLALLAWAAAVRYGHDTPRRARRGEPGRRALTVWQVVGPRLVYFGVALFAGLARGPVSADLLHLYAAFTYHLGPAQIGYLATGAAALTLPIGFVSGWMMDRYGRKRTMVPGFAGVALAMAALGVSAWVHLPLVGYVILFFFGVAVQALTGGSIQTVGADVAPPEARGMFLGLWRFAGQGGVSVSPTIFALLATEVGYGWSFAFTAVAAVVVTSLLVGFVPETRQAPGG